MDLIRDIPSEKPCKIVNPKLWLYFQTLMLKYRKVVVISNWSEADVVQYIDLELDKYLHDTLDTDLR